MTRVYAPRPLAVNPPPYTGHVPVPAHRGLPHPPAAHSLGTGALSRARARCTYADTLRPLNAPSESPPSLSGNSGSAHPAQPAGLHRRYPSPTTVGQHCGKIPENSSRTLACCTRAPVLNQAACGFSSTVFIIISFQTIVNGGAERLWGMELRSAALRPYTDALPAAGNSRCASNLRKSINFRRRRDCIMNTWTSRRRSSAASG